MTFRDHHVEYKKQDAYHQLIGQDHTNTINYEKMMNKAITGLYEYFHCEKIKSNTDTYYPHTVVSHFLNIENFGKLLETYNKLK